MRLPCRTKVFLDPEMNLHRSALKPASTALRQLRRFRDFLHPEQPPIERARQLLSAHRHSQLHMMNVAERIRSHIKIPKDSRLGCPPRAMQRGKRRTLILAQDSSKV